MHLYYSLTLTLDNSCVGSVGVYDAVSPGSVETTWKYHPGVFEVLTLARYPGWGQCMVGSLTGAVSSQSVTEEFEGTLGTVGNRADSALA